MTTRYHPGCNLRPVIIKSEEALDRQPSPKNKIKVTVKTLAIRCSSASARWHVFRILYEYKYKYGTVVNLG